ncbi:MAG: hypothetical protein ACYCW6_05950 [Candidatus Xenobia bacterium]
MGVLLILVAVIAVISLWFHRPHSPTQPPAAAVPAPRGRPSCRVARRPDWSAYPTTRFEAEARIKRLAASEASDLPENIRRYLERRGLTIPQTPGRPPAGYREWNVIAGTFYSPGQRDWAVLASRQHMSTILVFRNGRTDVDPDALHTALDASFLWYEDSPCEGFTTFYRSLTVATATDIESCYENGGGYARSLFPLPVVEHAGIWDCIYTQQCHIFYRHDGRWLDPQVPGC